MGVYKEQVAVLESFHNIQFPIYEDACDVGIFLDGVKDPDALLVAKTIKEFQGMGFDTHRTSELNKASDYVTHTINIPWDMDDNDGSYHCDKWVITYINDKVRKVKFMVFQCENVKCWYDEIYIKE